MNEINKSSNQKEREKRWEHMNKREEDNGWGRKKIKE